MARHSLAGLQMQSRTEWVKSVWFFSEMFENSKLELAHGRMAFIYKLVSNSQLKADNFRIQNDAKIAKILELFWKRWSTECSLAVWVVWTGGWVDAWWVLVVDAVENIAGRSSETQSVTEWIVGAC